MGEWVTKPWGHLRDAVESNSHALWTVILRKWEGVSIQNTLSVEEGPWLLMLWIQKGETAECWAQSCRTQVLRWAVVNMPWWQLSQGGGTKASRAPAVLGQWLFPSFASCWSPCCFYSSVNCSTQTAKWAVFPTCSLPVERPYFACITPLLPTGISKNLLDMSSQIAHKIPRSFWSL